MHIEGDYARILTLTILRVCIDFNWLSMHIDCDYACTLTVTFTVTIMHIEGDYDADFYCDYYAPWRWLYYVFTLTLLD